MPKSFICLPPTPKSILRRRVMVAVLFFLLATAYSAITPIFEISDEVRHYPVIDYIADTGKLPVQNKDNLRPVDWEAAQPPLYYVLNAVLVAPFNRDDLAEHLQENPHTKSGIGLATDNQNLVLHDEKFVWSGTPLHVHLLRLFSVLLGTWAVWMVFTVARLTVPNQPAVALGAMCITAFNPMFLGITGSVNNDNLVNALVPTGFALALTLWRDGFSWSRVGAMALVGTLAVASKVSGVIIFVPMGLSIALTIRRDQLPLRNILLSALIFVGVWGSLFGWWYLRNLDLYGDLFGNQHMAETVGLREESISVPKLIQDESGSFLAAYWGWLGGLTILAPITLFYYAGILWLLALVGMLLPRREGRQWGALAILLVGLVLAIYGVIAWTLITPASQGRLLFPFMVVISTLTAWGVVRLFGSRGGVLLTTLALIYAVVIIGYTIPRAFRLPEQFDMLPETAQPVDVQYGAIQLLGFEVDEAAIQPDGLLDVTLYWRAIQPTALPLSFYIQVYAPEAVEVGKLDSYPGRGLLQTDQWQTGVIYQDEYRLELKHIPDDLLPFEPRLKIGWRDNTTNLDVPPTTLLGEPLEAVILEGGAVYGDGLDVRAEAKATFGGAIRLHDIHWQQVEDTLIINVVWAGLVDIQEDFTVFAQLVEENTVMPILASGDSPPRDGWWDTRAWVPHHAFDDQFEIAVGDLAAGNYHLLMGFYRPTDFTRLPVDQSPYPDAVVVPVQIR